MKRKKKSKQGSKKLAKRGHRAAPSQPPDMGPFELDMTGVPREKLELTVSTLHRVNQGLRSSSERAESALSGMTRAVGKMTRARNDEKNLLMEENRLLKDLIGWRRVESQVDPQQPSSSEDETESLEEDEQEGGDTIPEEVGDA